MWYKCIVCQLSKSGDETAYQSLVACSISNAAEFQRFPFASHNLGNLVDSNLLHTLLQV